MPSRPACRGKREPKARRVAVGTHRGNVAYLHRDCSVCRTEGFRAHAKIEIANGRQRILTVLNVVDDDTIGSRDELGLSEPVFAQLNAKAGLKVEVGHAVHPEPLDAVGRKIAGPMPSAPPDGRTISTLPKGDPPPRIARPAGTLALPRPVPGLAGTRPIAGRP